MQNIPSSRGLWGWTAPARILLALAAAAGGLALWVLEPDGPGAVPEIPTLVVDPNTAPAHVLSAWPRIGPVLARNIVDARRDAPFRRLEDLDVRVRGIGPVTLRALRPHLRIDGRPAAAPRVSLSATVP
jgi:competence protein ComEA